MKTRVFLLIAITGLCGVVLPSQAGAQGFGGSGGYNSGRAANMDTLPKWSLGAPLPADAALNYIFVEGTAELRVPPEEIRVVLAVTSEGEAATECQNEIAQKIASVREGWREQQISDDRVVEDFISVLPVYEWETSEREEQEIRVQRAEGYRMQSNLHLAVKTESQAMEAINRAFRSGVTDIVTFDYWSSQIDQQKAKARKSALAAAKAKAKDLLSVFDEPPKVINVQEDSAVYFPNTLYKTYENILEERVVWPSNWRDKPRVLAYRPKMTFYHGLQSQTDVRPNSLPMRPEIAVISTVRLYYQSPAEKSRTAGD